MSKEYKQLVKAFFAYAFGIWVSTYSAVLISGIFVE